MTTSGPPSLASPDPPAGDAGPRPAFPLRAVFLLSAIIAGLSLTEQISANLLPLTIGRFTDNAFVISLIIALNPAFGFIAQPIVGILSDRIWTPIGRRAVFLVTGAPIVALCLFLVPQATALWQLVILVALYQLFQDVLWGSDHPLLADLIPAPYRTLAKGCMMTCSQVVALFFLKYGLGWVSTTYGDRALYWLGAAAQIVFVAAVALFLRERRVEPKPRPKLTVKRYVNDMLGDPNLRRFAMLAFSHGAFVSSVSGFVVLYAVKTLGIEKSAFGSAWSWTALISLCCAIPFGIAVQRINKSRALAIGYFIAMAGCVAGLFAREVDSFILVALIFGIGSLTIEVTIKPYFTEFLPPDLVGQLSGAYNICFALGRSLGSLGAGAAAWMMGNNYRAIWYFALVLGTVSIVTALRIRLASSAAVPHPDPTAP